MNGKKARLTRVLAHSACDPRIGLIPGVIGDHWGRLSYRWFVKKIKKTYRVSPHDSGLTTSCSSPY